MRERGIREDRVQRIAHRRGGEMRRDIRRLLGHALAPEIVVLKQPDQRVGERGRLLGDIDDALQAR